MQHGERWQRALDEAEAVLSEPALVGSRDARDGRRAARLGRARARRPPAMPARCAQHCARSKPGIERLDYGLAMSTANNWLGSPRPPVVLHLISDLQRARAPLRFADLEPPPQTQLVMHDIGDAAAENAFIEGAHAHDRRHALARSRRCAARRRQPQQRQVVLRSTARSTRAALSSCRRRAMHGRATSQCRRRRQARDARARRRKRSAVAVGARCCSPI